MSEETKTVEKGSFWSPVLQITIMVTLIVSTILTIFAWPLANATPRSVPIGVASDFPSITAQLQGQLDSADPGAFKLVEYKDLATAKKAVAHREVYGVLVIATHPQVLIASGASPTMAQLITSISIKLGQQFTQANGGHQLIFTPTDLAPLGTKDPRGLGLNAGSLPLIIAGIVVGILGSMRLKRRSQMFAVAGTAGVVAGLSIVAILNLWLGSLQGNYFLEVLVVAVGIAAVSLTVMGAAVIGKRAGLITVIAVFFIVGNPLSGVALPEELYPSDLGSLGQKLPLGAEVNLLRRISYFPEADTTVQWVTLGVWLAIGALLVYLSGIRKPKTD
jgi:hypothetical protein